MPSHPIIRFPTSHDCPAIAEIYRPFVEQTPVSFEEVPPTPEEMWHRIQKVLQKHCWLVCEYDGRVAGYVYGGTHRERAAYRFSVEVSVYIHPDFRKRSIGQALYTALHEILGLQGYVTSYAVMAIPNPASKAFHERFGYRQFAIFENVGYKLDKWYHTEWFYKPLSTPEIPARAILSVSELSTLEIDAIFRKAEKMIR